MNVRVSSFEETRTNKNLANCCGVRCPAFALCASSNACSLFATLCLPVGNCAFALAPFGFVAKRSYPYPSSVSLFRRVLRVSLAFEGWCLLLGVRCSDAFAPCVLLFLSVLVSFYFVLVPLFCLMDLWTDFDRDAPLFCGLRGPFFVATEATFLAFVWNAISACYYMNSNFFI